MKHLMDINDLTLSQIDQLIATANDIIADKDKYKDVCKGKKLATLFLNPAQGPG